MSANELPPMLQEAEAAASDAIAAGHRLARARLHQQVERYLGSEETSGVDALYRVRIYTALLQGVDATAQAALAEFSHTYKDFAPAPDRVDEWRTALVRLAWHDRAARLLRRQRRQAVAAALGYLEHSKDLNSFAAHVVYPLLARAWLPSLTYEPPARPPERTLWDQRAMPRSLPEGINDPRGVINWVTSLTIPLAPATAAYLWAALVVCERIPGRVPISAPVLLVPGNMAWPLGHIMDVLVLPADALTQGGLKNVSGLTNDSLTPARAAVDAFFAGEPMLESELRAGGAVAVPGDYPGGGHLSRQVQGPSGGLALAAAMLAHGGFYLPEDGAIATAQLTPTGAVMPLNDPVGLERKGRAAALQGYRTVVVATDPTNAGTSDGAALQRGAETVGEQLSIQPVATLGEIIGVLLGAPNRDQLQWCVADGALAEQALTAPMA